METRNRAFVAIVNLRFYPETRLRTLGQIHLCGSDLELHTWIMHSVLMHMRCATGLLEDFCARYAEAVAADAEARDFAVAVYEGFAQLRHASHAQRVVGEAEARDAAHAARQRLV